MVMVLWQIVLVSVIVTFLFVKKFIGMTMNKCKEKWVKNGTCCKESGDEYGTVFKNDMTNDKFGKQCLCEKNINVASGLDNS